MRLAGKVKLGYYPIPPEALALMVDRLDVGDSADRVTVLDPCCGAGAALKQIADSLRLKPSNVYGIELEDGRAAEASAAIPGANILGPCSYLSTLVRPGRSLSLVYLNPPFDDEIGGGGREEMSFLWRASSHLATGGILAMVTPYPSFAHGKAGDALREHLDCYYTDVEVFEFPSQLRKFQELFVFGVRRDWAINPKDKGFVRRWMDWRPYTFSMQPPYGSTANTLPTIGATDHRWTVPPGEPPREVVKRDYTDAELVRLVNDSPLNRHLDPPSPPPKKVPPLALGHGHRCLLLAAGELNGLLCPEGEQPHVVRGTCRKDRILKSRSESEDGKEVREVWSQRIVLTLRAVGADGVIKTFEQ
jgi:hypothetical protein